MNRDEHLHTIAAEECAELAQRFSKANRFGDTEVEPGQAMNNRQRILEEFAHLLAAMEMLGFVVDRTDALRPWMDAKKQKVERFLEYSRTCGTLA